MLHFRLSRQSLAGKLALAAAVVLALVASLSGRPVVQQTYTPPVLPPIFTASDLASSATTMTDVQSAYNNSTNLLLAHDSQLFTLSQTLQAQNGLILTLQQQVAALQAQVAALTPVISPTKATVTVQAASYTSASGQQAGFPVTCPGNPGTVTCNSAVGEILNYSFTAPVAGNYAFSMNVAASVASSVTVSVNGGAALPVTIPATGGFTMYEVATGPLVPLVGGVNTMTITYTLPHANIGFYTLAQQ